MYLIFYFEKHNYVTYKYLCAVFWYISFKKHAVGVQQDNNTGVKTSTSSCCSKRKLNAEPLEEQRFCLALFKQCFIVMLQKQLFFTTTRRCTAERTASRCALRRSSRKAAAMSKESVHPHTVFSTFGLIFGLFCRGKKQDRYAALWGRAAVWISRKGQLWTQRPEAKQNKRGVKYSGGRKAEGHKEP